MNEDLKIILFQIALNVFGIGLYFLAKHLEEIKRKKQEKRKKKIQEIKDEIQKDDIIYVNDNGIDVETLLKNWP